jgi:hypothetical protein
VQDVVDHPDRYNDELVALARELLEGRRKLEELSHRERELLNMGTFEFHQYRPPPPQKTKAPAPSPRPRQELKPVEPPPTPEPGVDVPEGASLRPYWWT